MGMGRWWSPLTSRAVLCVCVCGGRVQLQGFGKQLNGLETRAVAQDSRLASAERHLRTLDDRTLAVEQQTGSMEANLRVRPLTRWRGTASGVQRGGGR